jgi:galactokinase
MRIRAGESKRMRAGLQEAFQARFGQRPRIFRAPGRVNLIGEHTDYNDGFVMPAAIQFATWAAVAPRTDRHLVVHSENYGETCEFDLDEPEPWRRGHWSDYVLGVAVILQRSGIKVAGANLLIRSEVPIGAGLSSSAALEVAVAMALAPEPIEPVRVAKLCRRAEHEFAGVECGIMDQFVACHAKAGTALLLDCRSLEYSFAPLPGGVKMAIANSMVRHALAASEYNRRRAECAEAAAYFGKSLRDVTIEELNHKKVPHFRRARHVITENVRVPEAREALSRGDVHAFGRLMYQSHKSLREDYEVSCAELDTLVDIAREVPGVYGSRMTGGGFGGCTISLVAEDRVEAFRAAIAAGYPEAEVYVSNAADAAGPVEIM